MVENLKEGPSTVTGWYAKARRFLSEVRNEMNRVSWPARREVWATTLVVILTSMLFGVYLWGIDLGLSWVVDRIFRSFGGA